MGAADAPLLAQGVSGRMCDAPSRTVDPRASEAVVERSSGVMVTWRPACRSVRLVPHGPDRLVVGEEEFLVGAFERYVEVGQEPLRSADHDERAAQGPAVCGDEA
ncbi:hypothetical protein OG787_45970 [Streptomyces sp. NBC_00075]|uniref:hypothetical protein n=1 Tax=Streptomyces sp. NBC_00075 TaxID=2975641 RepID=UPI00324564C4